jgi:hypothetical protein
MLAMLMHTTSRENIPAFVDVGSQVLQRNNGHWVIVARNSHRAATFLIPTFFALQNQPMTIG